MMKSGIRWAIVLFFFFGLACNRYNSHEMTATKSSIVGNWIKVSQRPCSDRYPDSIEFREDGAYLTPMRDDVFLEWQSGDYELSGEGEVKIQTSNDAMVPSRYGFDEDGRLLVFFEDECECVFERSH